MESAIVTVGGWFGSDIGVKNFKKIYTSAVDAGIKNIGVHSADTIKMNAMIKSMTPAERQKYFNGVTITFMAPGITPWQYNSANKIITDGGGTSGKQVTPLDVLARPFGNKSNVDNKGKTNHPSENYDMYNKLNKFGVYTNGDKIKKIQGILKNMNIKDVQIKITKFDVKDGD